MNFKMASTPNLIFGVNKIKVLPQKISDFGKKAIIVTGKSSFLKTFAAIDLFQDIDYLKIETEFIHISGEPSPENIDDAVLNYKDWNPSVIVAIGGGSVMDAGKAISAMLCENGTVADYLEGVGTKIPSGRKIPLICVPTTSGTGSECTKNAVISRQGEQGYKKSLRHDNYIPNLALIDPALTVGCPALVTAASGMDAFTQLLESYLSTNSNPLCDALAFEAMEKITQSIEKAFFNGNDLGARSDLSYAAMLSGIALANAGLGVVHGFAQPLGSLFSVPHGVVCGTLMEAANRITVQRLKEQNKLSVLEKYGKVAQLISTKTDQNEAIDDLLDYLDKLTKTFNLARLSNFGILESDFPTILAETGLKYHPVELSDEDLEWILRERL